MHVVIWFSCDFSPIFLFVNKGRDCLNKKEKRNCYTPDRDHSVCVLHSPATQYCAYRQARGIWTIRLIGTSN
jgi:hypothetical protein